MIFTKGEVVKVTSNLKEHEQLNGKIGIVHTVSELELPFPFVVKFYSEEKIVIETFEFYELELFNGSNDQLIVSNVKRLRQKLDDNI